MRKPNREINVFNLSMLDVIAGAMAAFLIIMIVLLPYYGRLPIEYKAMVEALRAQLVEAVRRTEVAEHEAVEAQAGVEVARQSLQKAREEVKAARAKAEALEKKDLDVMIVLDTTGSMADEIHALQANVKDLVRILGALSATRRVGLVAYRDTDTLSKEYVIRPFPLTRIDTAGQIALERFIDALSTDGGETWEEAVYEGLAAAIDQDWRPSADGVIVVIGDARAHAHQVQATYALAARFRARSARYRVSTISARVEAGHPSAWNAGTGGRAVGRTPQPRFGKRAHNRLAVRAEHAASNRSPGRGGVPTPQSCLALRLPPPSALS